MCTLRDMLKKPSCGGLHVHFITQKVAFLTHYILKPTSTWSFCSFDAEFHLFLTEPAVATLNDFHISFLFYLGSYTNPSKQSQLTVPQLIRDSQHFIQLKCSTPFLNKGWPTRWHLLYYILLNMFQTLIRPSSGSAYSRIPHRQQTIPLHNTSTPQVSLHNTTSTR